VFFKWMEGMFEEFYKQGDLEKRFELPISKSTFMDRDNMNREKVYVAYMDIVCQPLFNTFLIIVNEDVKKIILEDGFEKNRKHLENRIDDNSK